MVRSCPSSGTRAAGASGFGVRPAGGAGGTADIVGVRAPQFEQNGAVDGVLVPQEGHNVSAGSGAGKRLAQLKHRVWVSGFFAPQRGHSIVREAMGDVPSEATNVNLESGHGHGFQYLLSFREGRMRQPRHEPGRGFRPVQCPSSAEATNPGCAIVVAPRVRSFARGVRSATVSAP